MMAAANGNSTRVKRLAHGPGIAAVDQERHDAAPALQFERADDAGTRNGLQAVQQAPGERAPMLRESGPVQPLQPFGRGAQSDSAGNWRCAPLRSGAAER